MSRIGNNPISIPAGTKVEFDDKSHNLKIIGKLGELSLRLDPDLVVSIEDDFFKIGRPTDQKRHRAMHGLYRSLASNMMVGVTEGYELRMQVVGVGYRAESQGNQLTLALGFSHPIIMILPEEVKVETESVRGKDPLIILKSIDKQLIGQVAAKIRKLRPPEPYKGKGIRFVGEQIRRKAGKAAAAK